MGNKRRTHPARKVNDRDYPPPGSIQNGISQLILDSGLFTYSYSTSGRACPDLAGRDRLCYYRAGPYYCAFADRDTFEHGDVYAQPDIFRYVYWRSLANQIPHRLASDVHCVIVIYEAATGGNQRVVSVKDRELPQ